MLRPPGQSQGPHQVCSQSPKMKGRPRHATKTISYVLPRTEVGTKLPWKGQTPYFLSFWSIFYLDHCTQHERKLPREGQVPRSSESETTEYAFKSPTSAENLQVGQIAGTEKTRRSYGWRLEHVVPHRFEARLYLLQCTGRNWNLPAEGQVLSLFEARRPASIFTSDNLKNSEP